MSSSTALPLVFLLEYPDLEDWYTGKNPYMVINTIGIHVLLLQLILEVQATPIDVILVLCYGKHQHATLFQSSGQSSVSVSVLQILENCVNMSKFSLIFLN